MTDTCKARPGQFSQVRGVQLDVQPTLATGDVDGSMFTCADIDDDGETFVDERQWRNAACLQPRELLSFVLRGQRDLLYTA